MQREGEREIRTKQAGMMQRKKRKRGMKRERE
jgi:hypothetical protein